MKTIQLGLKENARQFGLLVVINAFVGGMIGLERSVFPKLAEQEFGITSKTAFLSFIVTFGITPTHPETGFGYIHVGPVIDNNGDLIERFVEKPDLATAQGYLESGHFVWNSGMFCFRADALIEAAQLHAPELLAQCQACFDAVKGAQNPIHFPPDLFKAISDISFDYAIMEHAPRRAVVKATFDWNDIGSWKSLSELSMPDSDGILADDIARLLAMPSPGGESDPYSEAGAAGGAASAGGSESL